MTHRWTGPSWLQWILWVLGSYQVASAPSAQVGTVVSEQKISETAGGLGGVLDMGDRFGSAVAALGDLDGDRVGDIAVGAELDDDGGVNQGAVWILFLNADGTVVSEQKISETAGGFGGDLDPSDSFGCSVAALGDLDGDGVGDLAVGDRLDDDGDDDNQGAVWILFLNPDGTVASEQKISETAGGFEGVLHGLDFFGCSVAALGDLDDDGVCDLAVGAQLANAVGGTDQGAVWILFLNADGTVASEQRLTKSEGGFGGDLDPGDSFGSAVTALGDLDGDGVPDLAVGTEGDESQGAVWVLFLNTDGTVASEQKISESNGGFGGVLDLGDRFGSSVAALGDLDGDGIVDLAVGADQDGDGGDFQGGLWILFLHADGTVASEQKISETTGGFGGDLDPVDLFGASVAVLGDLDGDGFVDLAVGATGDDDGGGFVGNQGAVWILFLEGPPCFTLDFETEDDFATPLGNGQALSTPPEFGDLVRISSAGANAGPAIFDTTPGGPNDPALNSDMLIGHGNVLLLEDDWYAFAQIVPGFFDVVTDDPHGGDLFFEFTSPVAPRSIQLADINPPPNQGASVTLIDWEGRTRTYAVEPGWTGTYGDAGPHLLDLTTLAPQPGNGTPRFATASEMPEFEATRVVRLVVHLTGFGAIDDLTFCVPDLAQASATPRNGAGVNPTILRSDSMPVLGESWTATLDCSGTGSGLALIELRDLAASGTVTPFGEVLVEGALLHRTSRAYSSSPSSLAWQVPYDISLLGLEVHAQGLCRRQASVGKKTRAARIVLSNAVDLVLGF